MNVWLLKNFVGPKVYGIYTEEDKAWNAYELLKHDVNDNVKLSVVGPMELDSNKELEKFIHWF